MHVMRWNNAYPAKRVFAAAFWIGGVEDVDINLGSIKRLALEALHQYSLRRV